MDKVDGMLGGVVPSMHAVGTAMSRNLGTAFFAERESVNDAFSLGDEEH